MEKVEGNCAACHTLAYIAINSVYLNSAGWDAEATKMIRAFGAQIDKADAKVIADDLKKNYGLVSSRSGLRNAKSRRCADALFWRSSTDALVRGWSREVVEARLRRMSARERSKHNMRD